MASTAAPTEEPAAEEETEHLSIDAQGDTVLAVGKYKIKVSSTMLALVSPVFKAMLGPHFQEGSGVRSAVNPLEIPLSEDDPDAVINLCRLIYHQSNQVTEEMLHTEGLYHVMKAIDKYQCLEPLMFQVRWLVTTELKDGTGNWRDSVLHAAIAYLADDGLNFKLATSNLITKFDGTFSDVHDFQGGEVIPLNALLAMSEICQIAKRRFSEHFADLVRGKPKMSVSAVEALERWASLDGDSLGNMIDELMCFPTDTQMHKLGTKIKDCALGCV